MVARLMGGGSGECNDIVLGSSLTQTTAVSVSLLLPLSFWPLLVLPLAATEVPSCKLGTELERESECSSESSVMIRGSESTGNDDACASLKPVITEATTEPFTLRAEAR